MEVLIPGTLSSSGDDLDLGLASISLASPEPDPILGSYVSGDSAPRVESPPDAPAEQAPGPPPVLADLDFDAAPGPALATGSGSVEFERQGRGRTPWPIVVLGSYASAMTLACLWLLLSGRSRHQPADATIPADSRPDLGARSDRSRVVEPAAPVPEGRTTTLGNPLRVGMLEFTPLEVVADDVTLRRRPLTGEAEEREGGLDALRLRVRLRNRSEDAVFAPLDEAFVREPDRGLPESFLEDADGVRTYPYPLPQQSEWSIVGQEFRDLKPGEVIETDVVSAEGVADGAKGTLTWRLRLRTGPESTETVAVRFDADAIRRDGP
jgi:hypothetical protein